VFVAHTCFCVRQSYLEEEEEGALVYDDLDVSTPKWQRYYEKASTKIEDYASKIMAEDEVLKPDNKSDNGDFVSCEYAGETEVRGVNFLDEMGKMFGDGGAKKKKKSHKKKKKEERGEAVEATVAGNTHRAHIADTSRTHRGHIADTSRTHRGHIADTSRTYRGHTADIPRSEREQSDCEGQAASPPPLSPSYPPPQLLRNRNNSLSRQ